MKRDLSLTLSATFIATSCVALLGFHTAMAQGTRSSNGLATDPLMAIASGIDPLTGQNASVPFNAPTTFGVGTSALPPLVSTTGAQPIFISDTELSATQGFDTSGGFATPSGFASPAGFASPTGAVTPLGAAAPIGAANTGGGFGTPGANAGFGFVDTSSGATQFFISDGELGGGSTTLGGGFTAGANLSAGRLPGQLPIVGPEYSAEIPGMGLSVVSAIPTVTASQADQIAIDIATGTTTFVSPTGASVGVGGSVPVGLPTPAARRVTPTNYVSGNLAACRAGFTSCQTRSDNPIANPNPVSSVTPVASTQGLNSPSTQGVPSTFATFAVPDPETESAADGQTQPSPDAAVTTPATTASAGGCTGPVLIQFADDAKELNDSHKQRLRTLVSACRETNPDVVYRVVAYPDSANAGDATARQVPGARLFDVRFFMAESGISIQNLDLSPDFDSGLYNNALLITLE